MFKHIVLFRFHDAKNAPEDRRRLEAMEGQVADLSAIEVGLDILHTEHSWDMVVHTAFADEAAYRRYAVDPIH